MKSILYLTTYKEEGGKTPNENNKTEIDTEKKRRKIRAKNMKDDEKDANRKNGSFFNEMPLIDISFSFIKIV